MKKHTSGASPFTKLVWTEMIKRATGRTALDHYAARGITVCKRWLSFENFIVDMGNVPKGMTLDRINNNKGYSPSNCRWASQTQQNRNKRNTIYVRHEGQRVSLADLADSYGIPKQKAYYRFKQGWTIDLILALPKTVVVRGDLSKHVELEEKINRHIRKILIASDASILRVSQKTGIEYSKLNRFFRHDRSLALCELSCLYSFLTGEPLVQISEAPTDDLSNS